MPTIILKKIQIGVMTTGKLILSLRKNVLTIGLQASKNQIIRVHNLKTAKQKAPIRITKRILKVIKVRIQPAKTKQIKGPAIFGQGSTLILNERENLVTNRSNL